MQARLQQLQHPAGGEGEVGLVGVLHDLLVDAREALGLAHDERDGLGYADEGGVGVQCGDEGVIGCERRLAGHLFQGEGAQRLEHRVLAELAGPAHAHLAVPGVDRLVDDLSGALGIQLG